ncbi:MAG: hypothetical protein H6Q36_1721, partial [Chloroflexi bacterium]|nr:hypothetical protein [Chloroflexota bacterium]
LVPGRAEAAIEPVPGPELTAEGEEAAR